MEDSYSKQQYEAQQPASAYGEVPVSAEKIVAAAWVEVLGVEPKDIDNSRSDFFELGGHSLLAVQVIARVVESVENRLTMDTFELEGLLLNELFDRPTVAAQAETLMANGLSAGAEARQESATEVSGEEQE